MDVSKIVYDKLFIRGASMKTITAYELQINSFNEWINKPHLKVKQSDVEEYVKYLRNKGYAHSSINLAIAAIKFFWCDIMKRRFQIKSLKKQEKHTGVCDKNNIISAIDGLSNPKHKLLLMLLYGSGLRVGEAVNIKHQDIMGDELIVRQGKGARDRKAVLSDTFLDAYGSFKKDKGFVFKGVTGSLSVRSAQVIVKKAFKEKHVHPHMMRASFATHLHESKIDKYDIQKFLGHKDLRTTMIYTKYSTLNPNKIKSPLDT